MAKQISRSLVKGQKLLRSAKDRKLRRAMLTYILMDMAYKKKTAYGWQNKDKEGW